MNAGNELRIGVLSCGDELPHWQVQCIRHLLDEPRVQLVALGMATDQGTFPRSGSMLDRAVDRSSRLLHPRTHIRGSTSHVIGPRRVDVRSGPAGDLLDEFKSLGIEVVLSLLPPQEMVSHTAFPALWQFHFNGHGLGRHGSPELRSWMTAPEPAMVTLRCTRTGHEVNAVFGADGEHGGPDMDTLLLGSAWLPVSMARSWTRPAAADVPPSQEIKRSGEVSPLSLITSWLHLELRHSFKGASRSARDGEWNIGVLPQPIASLLSDGGSMNVRWLSSPASGSHRAEPFGYTAADGQMNVLYRKSPPGAEADLIARIRPKGDGILKRSRTMLSTTSPLSYPFVVARAEGIHVVVSYPHQQRTELFRVAESNESLEHVSTLLERALVNPTAVEYEGRWWLFGTDVDVPDGVLLAYHASDFLGPYTPHARNPVRISGANCRPAGTFFTHQGSLWRPSLDSTDPEAPGIVFNKVLELTPEHFQEEPKRTMAGFPGTFYADGIRTVCALGDITLVDGLRTAADDREPAESERSSRRSEDNDE